MILKIFQIVVLVITKTIQFFWQIVKKIFSISDEQSNSNLVDAHSNSETSASLVSTQAYQASADIQVNSCHFVDYAIISYAVPIPKEKVFRADIIDLSDWNDNNGNYYYHYTSVDCAKKILRDRRIIASVPKVRHFGKNVYFTKCKPGLSDYQLVVNNYIYFAKRYLKNIECVFAFHKHDLKMMRQVLDKYERNIWGHANDIDLNRTDFKVIIRQPNYRYRLSI
jgi:hypothetical protein